MLFGFKPYRFCRRFLLNLHSLWFRRCFFSAPNCFCWLSCLFNAILCCCALFIPFPSFSQPRPAETPNGFRDVHEKSQWTAAREFVCACTCRLSNVGQNTTGKLWGALHPVVNPLSESSPRWVWQRISIFCVHLCPNKNSNIQQRCLAEKKWWFIRADSYHDCIVRIRTI